MRQIEGVVRGTGGLRLHLQAWLPEGSYTTLILIVHGVHENCRHYAHLVDYFVQRGTAVYGYDQRGHGRSEGQVGHIDAWSEYREDLRLVLQELRAREPGARIFLFCHSMGALVGTDFAEHYAEGYAGAVISGAPFEPVGIASPLLVFVARLMSRIAPRFSFNLGIHFEDVTRDPVEMRSLQEDPLVHHDVSARWGTESLRTVAEAKSASASIASPLLFVHGEADRLNAPHGTQAFFDALPLKDKSLRLYPGSFHNIHADEGWEAEMRDVEEWIAAH